MRYEAEIVICGAGTAGSVAAIAAADAGRDVIVIEQFGAAGGSGTLMGTLLGCLIIGIIGNILNLVGVNSYYQLIVKGIVIVAAIYIDIAKNRLGVRRSKR